ncbi:MAG: peptidoglycan-binding domain-containing protein [Christensenellales bacterium]
MLQMRLTELGYYHGSITGGYYGGTIQAVKDFQSDYGLTVDGAAASRRRRCSSPPPSIDRRAPDVGARDPAFSAGAEACAQTSCSDAAPTDTRPRRRCPPTPAGAVRPLRIPSDNRPKATSPERECAHLCKPLKLA